MQANWKRGVKYRTRSREVREINRNCGNKITHVFKHQAVKMCRRVEVQLHAFLSLALVVNNWSASRHVRFTLRERSNDIYWIESWVDLTMRVSLDIVKKRKSLSFNLKSIILVAKIINTSLSKRTIQCTNIQQHIDVPYDGSVWPKHVLKS
jgi:hypothetical protein